MRREQRARILAHADAHAEGRRDRIGGDVVMRRPDTARGEDVVPVRAQRVQRRHDAVVVVGNNAHLAQIDSMPRQLARQMVHVRVARAARQDLVADYQHRGGWVASSAAP
jgi:hypothetical protein